MLYLYLGVPVEVPCEWDWGDTAPVKDSHTRIKPLALSSGHGRCIAVMIIYPNGHLIVTVERAFKGF